MLYLLRIYINLLFCFLFFFALCGIWGQSSADKIDMHCSDERWAMLTSLCCMNDIQGHYNRRRFTWINHNVKSWEKWTVTFVPFCTVNVEVALKLGDFCLFVCLFCFFQVQYVYYRHNVSVGLSAHRAYVIDHWVWYYISDEGNNTK